MTTTTSSADSLRLRRREALVGLGAGFAGLTLGLFNGRVLAADDKGGALKGSVVANDWVTIKPDGTVQIVCHRSEMGQGVRSSLPLLIADELGASLDKVSIVQADGHPKYGDQNTDGSSSVREGFDDLRKLGATARTMLVTVAAGRWKVDASTCTTRDHVVVHLPTQRTLAFAELVAVASKLKVPDSKKVQLRPRAELTRIGTDQPFVDVKAYVTGTAIYAADVQLPGLLTAVVLRPPTVLGKVHRVNDERARAVPGVKDVVVLNGQIGAGVGFQPLGGVAVIAENTWAAMRGRAALEVEWELGKNASYDSVAFRKQLEHTVRQPGKVVRDVGDVDEALKAAKQTVVGEYYVPHLVHVPMEPPAAVCRITDDGAEIWACTQNPQSVRDEVAKALELPVDKVVVHVTFLGGGFGRKSKADFCVEAALLAKAAKAPVRVQWTRSDDIQHDYFHTVSAQRLEAGLDANKQITAWKHRTSFPPIPSTFVSLVKTPSGNELGQGVLDHPLAIKNVRAEAGDAEAHVRIGWLRSVCNIFHAFAIGSFIDELAHARGVDPLANLLEVIGAPRYFTPKEAGVDKFPNYGADISEHPIDVARFRHVIERAATLSGMSNAPVPGRAFGIAAHRSFLTSVACVFAVKREGDRIVVDEATIVADAGTVLNLDRVKNQME
ncbi:MAG TPA: molybdopterin cofactor-binding domain-containing protein, partial [Myxococcota bacterium]